MQGAYLRGAQLQGADLRRAGLWNVVANRQTQIGRGVLRSVNSDVAPKNSAERARQLAGVPNAASKRIDIALTPRVGARTLPRVATDDGPMLLDTSDAPAFAALQPGQTTTDVALYDSQLAALLADMVAPIAPEVAERMVSRANDEWTSEQARSLGKDLACRLIAAADHNAVQLKSATLKYLNDRVGTGCPPPAKP